MAEPFRIAITNDFRTTASGLLEPILAELLDPYPFIEREFLPETGHIKPEQIRDFDAIITLHPRFDAHSFTGVDRLTIIARWGVGFDMIDVPDCTDANVLLAITTDSVRKPVAEANVTFILALAKKLQAKDRLVRSGRWDLKSETAGIGLSGKIVGSLGLGNIASETFRLLFAFDFDQMIAHDPYVSQEHARTLGVNLVDLPALFENSDFLMVNCLLSQETRGMVNLDLLSLMKPGSYLINTARGPIVNQGDLIQALESNQIAGAGLDVFDQEPLPNDSPLINMENVVLSPHSTHL